MGSVMTLLAASPALLAILLFASTLRLRPPATR